MEENAHYKRIEIKCVKLLPALPLWIIEYAWSKRLTDLLNVFGPPLWLEGDWRSLTLAEPCSVRAAAAEASAVLRARDVEHYERVLEFLEVTQKLLPLLVSSIKHMKIVFGFKTLVIMWMIQKGHCPVSTMEKTIKFFPGQHPQYRKCSRRHMDLMRKNSEDFREFAVSLARDEDLRQAYIRDLLEEQYGDRYAQKLQQRLDYYLQQLESALPQLTCLDQVLRREWPMTEGEELMLDLLASSSNSLPVALERLLQCALIDHSSLSNTPSSPHTQPSALGDLGPTFSPITVIYSQQSRKHGSRSHDCCTGDINRNSTQKHLSCSQEPQSAKQQATSEIRLREEGREDFDSPLLLEEENSSERSWDHDQERGGERSLEKDRRKEEVELEVEVDRTEKEVLEKMGGDRRGEEEEEEVAKMEEEGWMEVERMEDCGGRAEVVFMSGGRQMCSTHHKMMTSILLECSQELLTQGGHSPLQPDTPILLSQHGPSQDPIPTGASSPKEAAPSGQGCRQAGASPVCMLRISAETQALLIRSPLLQPLVLLTRLSPQNCRQSTGGAEEIVSLAGGEEEEIEEEEEDKDEESMLFDVNSLFTDSSSESESDNSDSDYVPSSNKRREALR